MEFLVISGIVAGFIAVSEGVKRACRSYLNNGAGTKKD